LSGSDRLEQTLQLITLRKKTLPNIFIVLAPGSCA
jgi:hypothetical protein